MTEKIRVPFVICVFLFFFYSFLQILSTLCPQVTFLERACSKCPTLPSASEDAGRHNAVALQGNAMCKLEDRKAGAHHQSEVHSEQGLQRRPCGNSERVRAETGLLWHSEESIL